MKEAHIQRLGPLLIAATLVTAGCAHGHASRMAPQAAGSCRSALARWYAPEDEASRRRLQSWCAGVGPMTIASGAAAPAAPVPLSDIAFVSWNVHVGNGHVRAFVEDLRAGRLTNGRVPRHVVLLLQEAVRASGVPPFAPEVKGARRIRAHSPEEEDIEALSGALGLWMVYAPSMRNGRGAGDPAADRGSAILSTLPLSNPMAIELPIARQRRVALFADVALSGSDNTAALPVGVIHLDALDAAQRLWVFGSQGWRETQARSVETLLPGGTLVMGADLNTWLGENEPASHYFQRLLGGTMPVIEGARTRRRALDYLFFRGSATPHYLVVSNRYGSDHHPLIGWLSN